MKVTCWGQDQELVMGKEDTQVHSENEESKITMSHLESDRSTPPPPPPFHAATYCSSYGAAAALLCRDLKSDEANVVSRSSVPACLLFGSKKMGPYGKKKKG